jgi:hypothetical protein
MFNNTGNTYGFIQYKIPFSLEYMNHKDNINRYLTKYLIYKEISHYLYEHPFNIPSNSKIFKMFINIQSLNTNDNINNILLYINNYLEQYEITHNIIIQPQFNNISYTYDEIINLTN